MDGISVEVFGENQAWYKVKYDTKFTKMPSKPQCKYFVMQTI